MPSSRHGGVVHHPKLLSWVDRSAQEHIDVLLEVLSSLSVLRKLINWFRR
jgi:hypothetical protein